MWWLPEKKSPIGTLETSLTKDTSHIPVPLDILGNLRKAVIWVSWILILQKWPCQETWQWKWLWQNPLMRAAAAKHWLSIIFLTICLWNLLRIPRFMNWINLYGLKIRRSFWKSLPNTPPCLFSLTASKTATPWISQCRWISTMMVYWLHLILQAIWHSMRTVQMEKQPSPCGFRTITLKCQKRDF